MMRKLRVKEGNWVVPGHQGKWEAESRRRAQIRKVGLLWNETVPFPLGKSHSEQWCILDALQSMFVLGRTLGALICIEAALWDPEMEAAIKRKSGLLFSASLHRLTTAGTNRCGPQRSLLAVLVPSLGRSPFPRLNKGCFSSCDADSLSHFLLQVSPES